MAMASEHSSLDLTPERLRDLIGKWDTEVPASPAATTLLFILENLAVRVAKLEHGAHPRGTLVAPPQVYLTVAWENYAYQRESVKGEETAKAAFEAGWRAGYDRGYIDRDKGAFPTVTTRMG